jgi:PTS hybrid protein
VSVGLVVVSHSAKIAEGVVELAGQMAAEGEGVLVLVDLGSAVLSAQLAIDELVEEEARDRVRIAEAPVVEGAVVAAIQASTGSSLEEVDRAARGASTMAKVKPEEPGPAGGQGPGGAPVDQVGR